MHVLRQGKARIKRSRGFEVKNTILHEGAITHKRPDFAAQKQLICNATV